MSTFVLIHGTAHGGWCWYKVVAALEKYGHTVLAPDLPGHGRDKTPVAEVTLQRYVDSVCKLLDAQREPVILVGHSMSGGIITQTIVHGNAVSESDLDEHESFAVLLRTWRFSEASDGSLAQRKSTLNH